MNSKVNRISSADIIRDRIMGSGDHYWTYADFTDLPPAAVSQTLSRLTRDGEIKRVRKGIYYRPKQTVIGESRPSPIILNRLLLGDEARPTGITAANLLGFTTQNPGRPTYAISKSHAPTNLPGVKVTVRRPARNTDLDVKQGALLEFLRDRGSTSDLNPVDTVRKLVDILHDVMDFEKLADAAMMEPPRVRAMLGALGEAVGVDETILRKLRESLNPYSHFDFGKLQILPSAKEWQSK